MMKNQSGNQNMGFTLIELMVCVAVVGILSSVSVPLFKNYQIKARSSEGKLLLSSIHKAEQSFYSEYGFYATCLDFMGHNPGQSYYFSHGFSEANLLYPGVLQIMPCASSTNSFYPGTKWVSPATSSPTADNIGPAFTVPGFSQTYRAVAVGNIGNEVTIITWSNPLVSSAFAQSYTDDGSNTIILYTLNYSPTAFESNETGLIQNTVLPYEVDIKDENGETKTPNPPKI